MPTTTLAHLGSAYRPFAETWQPPTATMVQPTDYMTLEELRINATSRLKEMLSKNGVREPKI
ncbi:hypothetical protein AGMMS4956_02950 [Bacteroidia bacterium]|nr:hypothetical protein AGMMS4956_02950 [Bacteroidia bacterium]